MSGILFSANMSSKGNHHVSDRIVAMATIMMLASSELHAKVSAMRQYHAYNSTKQSGTAA
jgi:hypothetical protein